MRYAGVFCLFLLIIWKWNIAMTKDMPKRLALGVDIGSTTAKICLMDGERVL